MTALLSVVFAVVVISNRYAEPAKQLHGWSWLGPIASIGIAMVAVHLFGRLRAEVTDEAFVIRYGFGWPVQRITWDRVASVEAISVRPAEWGGWGFRWVPRKKATAAVMRSGDGLKFEFGNGRRFVVTIDGAAKALEVIRRVLADK